MVTPDSASQDDDEARLHAEALAAARKKFDQIDLERPVLVEAFDLPTVRQFERLGPLITTARRAISDAMEALAAAAQACGLDLEERQDAIAAAARYLHAGIDLDSIDALPGAGGAE